MCVSKTIRRFFGKFAADSNGSIPLDFVAVTASLALLGATYLETQAQNSAIEQTEIREEVYVRKCGGTRSAVTDMTIGAQNASLTCD